MEKLGLDPSVDPIGAQTLAKKFLNESKCIYCNRITLLPKQIDMKITSCLAVEPQSSVKISFCSVFKLLLLEPPLWSHVVLFFLIFEDTPIVPQEL